MTEINLDNLSRSLAQLAATTAGFLSTGIEHVDAAIRAERRRWFWMLLGYGVLLLWLAAASFFAGLTIVIAYHHVVMASALVAAGFLILAGTIGVMLWRCARRPPSASDRIAHLVALMMAARHSAR